MRAIIINTFVISYQSCLSQISGYLFVATSLCILWNVPEDNRIMRNRDFIICFYWLNLKHFNQAKTRVASKTTLSL